MVIMFVLAALTACAPTLAAYNRFVIDPIQVSYADPEMEELDAEQVGKMQKYFRDAII